MKHEWRKKEKTLYIPKTKPELITVPAMKFLTITGQGNPNGEAFSEKIQALYSLSYAIRMMPKAGITPEGYFEYTVYPLEGWWNLTESGQQKATLDKDELVYTIMIRQPDFVTEEVFKTALEIVQKKKKVIPLVEDVELKLIDEGLCVQMLHLGSFYEESKTFAIMEEFINENDLQIRTKEHREIYLSDFRKVAPEKLKTTLRYRVK